MATRPTDDRDKNLLRLLRSEFGRDLEGWLRAHGAMLYSDALRGVLHAYSRFPAAGGGGSEPISEATKQRFLRSRQRHEDDWLLRHVLDPTSPDCLLPPVRAKVLRARLLAKLRDRARNARGPVMTVRVSEETALGLDEIGRRLFGCTSRSETVKAMARVATTHLRATEGKPDGWGAG
ncbi:hypothetical protein IBL26_09670 [Roseomonas aerophila]|uniref:Uncharacterized protein n=1 Tax=Teichococcus aerophilus TaxID=1224513 RepID=A0ABR7RLT9_9PROT|nr:hypothetical protein [Pseudoroseomonas aerophila]MBC9207100.1 hypothetical protein [Pseudoroseomonas aerophila]